MKPGTLFILSTGPSLLGKPKNFQPRRIYTIKAFLQPSLRGLSGKMGDWVYHYSKNKEKTFIGEMPTSTKEQTEGQLAQQERFADAIHYATEAMEDTALSEFYTALAEVRDMAPRNVAMADYFNVPTFKPLELDNYKGQVGDPIVIRVNSKFTLATLEIAINKVDGTDIEKGQAVEVSTNKWVYRATQPVPMGADIFIDMVGICHTGRRVKASENPIVGARE
jgi:hypothetical protein